MPHYKLLGFSAVVGLSLGLLASLTMLAQAAPDLAVDKAIHNTEVKLNPAIPSPLSPAEIDPAVDGSIACDTYYFHNQQVNVGNHGMRRIANTTAPSGSSPVQVQDTISSLQGNVELIRFYSDPALAANLSISGDLTGSIWVQTTNSSNTTFIIEIFDYNPANGNTSSLGDYESHVLSTGQTELDFIITPPGTPIAAGHRLLVVISARTTALLFGPTVTFYYDSANRDSRFTVCQPTPPELAISKSGPATAIAGDLITYTLTISNSGGTAATNLVISDTIPAGANYLSGGTKVGNTITWNLASLGAGNSQQRTFVVTATATITNSVYQVKADGNVSAVGQKTVVTSISQPGQPNLTISKSGPATAVAGDAIIYTLTVFNGGDTAATNLVISDTIPAGANYVSGGTKAGNTVTWNLASLAANTSKQRTFVVTATTSITNSDYRVVADGNFSATGQEVVTTLVTDKALSTFYFPLILKPEETTTLVIKSVNTGLIDPLQVIHPTTKDELLSCVIGNNVTKTCGTFPAIGTYKVIANTANCGVLQGTFHDAQPGATVTRQVFCN